MAALTLYYREGCHLCDDMRKELIFYIEQHQISYTEIDIDRDSQLIEKYNTKVPVLCLNGEEVCHYFFDQAMLQKMLSKSSC